MQKFRIPSAALAAVVLAAGVVVPGTADAGQDNQVRQKENDDDRRPEFRLVARPSAVIAPGRVALTGELVGGADDFEEYYCPSIEWDWGDGTVSESTSDCDPYVEGQSKIRRRFTVEHLFRIAGRIRVYIRLKQRDDDVVAAASANIFVREGIPYP